MSSNFPNAVDSFVNPQYSKVNGVDYVKAEHINDLQDSVRNIQLSIIGNGISLNIASNNYVPSNASIKSAIEILDGEMHQRELDFNNHTSSVLATDPIQHHANVIRVSSIGNLSSDRLQTALEELQNDIDMIMTGGVVNSLSLDERYILSGGPAVVTGTMEVRGALTVLNNVVFGLNQNSTAAVLGDLSVGKDFVVNGKAEFKGLITIPATSRIGSSVNPEYTNISFATDKVSVKSLKDIEFQIDSDDAVDSLAQSASFKVKNGTGTDIFTLSEDGTLAIQTKVVTAISEASSHMLIGSSETVQLESGKMSSTESAIVVQVDKNNLKLGEYFAVTQDGDNGELDSSTDILLKVDESKIIAGSHIQKRGVPETGYFGIKFYSDNAGGKFQGYGVNFKSKMIATPSSITLSIDPDSFNYGNLSISDVSEYGFFIECDSLAVGNVDVRGTYTTVGN